jgi:hypothetical protein
LRKPQNILICPLEWGLGHAARMIPVASRLMESDKVFVGAGHLHLDLFRSELKGAEYIHFPGFRPRYSRHLPQYLAMLLKTPLLLYHIISEHIRLRKIISKYSIDIVISDNRFGLWNSSIKTVYFTHILRIPLPRALKPLEQLGVLLHRLIINRYSFCFIPDLPGDLNLSGRLSHGLKLPANARYAGILSRFSTSHKPSGHFGFRHFTVILSGPEPQRSILRSRLIDALKEKDHFTVILEGRPDEASEPEQNGRFIHYSHIESAGFAELVKTSDCIISRSGYTTIMDLVTLGCSALLIPTPGQTEQEYLAEYLRACGWFSTISQEQIDGDIAVQGVKSALPDYIVAESRILLEKALSELFED